MDTLCKLRTVPAPLEMMPAEQVFCAFVPPPLWCNNKQTATILQCDEQITPNWRPAFIANASLMQIR